jgi:hypothetical protein
LCGVTLMVKIEKLADEVEEVTKAQEKLWCVDMRT